MQSRESVTVTLFDKSAPESTELSVNWQVQASGTIRVVGRSFDCSGEMLIEDITIDSVESEQITYGDCRSHIDSLNDVLHRDRCLAWLQQQLASGDRDEWIEKIESRLSQLAENLVHA